MTLRDQLLPKTTSSPTAVPPKSKSAPNLTHLGRSDSSSTASGLVIDTDVANGITIDQTPSGTLHFAIPATGSGSPLGLEHSHRLADQLASALARHGKTPPPKPATGWRSYFTWRAVCNGAGKFTKFTLAAASAAGSAINAVAAVTKVDPKDMTRAWAASTFSWDTWGKLGVATNSVWNGISSMVVNIAVAYDFIPIAFNKLKLNVGRCFKTCPLFFGNLGTLFLGTAAALSAAGIAYGAFIWAGSIVAAISATVNLSIYFITRYVGVKTFINRLLGLWDKDVQATKEIIDALGRIQENYLAEVNALIVKHAKGEKINNENIHNILSALNLLILNNPDIVRSKTKTDTAKAFACTVFDMALATLAAGYVFPTFAEKGFEGVRAIGTLANGGIEALEKHQYVLSTLTAAEKLGVGFFPGAASSLLYWIWTFDFRDTLLSTCKEIYNLPTRGARYGSALLFGLVAGLNYSASPSMQNLAMNNLNNPDRILPEIATASTGYVRGNQFSGLCVNMKSSVAKAFGAITNDATGLVKFLKSKRDPEVKLTGWAATNAHALFTTLNTPKPAAPAPVTDEYKAPLLRRGSAGLASPV